MMTVLITLLGIVSVIAFLFLLSDNKKKVNFKMVGKGLIIQLVLAFLMIKVPAGQWFIKSISAFVTTILGYASDGIGFVFGDALGKGIFFIDALLVIIFLSALISILHYLGVVGFFIKYIGGAVSKIMGTEKAESFIATANIFMGQTESPIIVGKMIPKMTNSEIMVVLVAGMGSIAGSVLVGYTAMGIPMEYLLIGSTLVPIGSLLVSKILTPMTEKSQISNVEIDRKGDNTSVFSAMAEGIHSGVALTLGVMGSLIAGIGLIAMVNGGLGMFGTSIESIFSVLFLPIGLLMGLPFDEAGLMGQLLGVKMSLNEFVSYSQLAPMVSEISSRGYMMMSIALAGFSSFTSIAICVVGLSVLAPERKNDISKLAFRGMIGGFFVSVLSAMIVGLFI